MEQAYSLTDVEERLRTRYTDVRELGAGRAAFLRIGKGQRAAAISLDEEGWLVELWHVSEREPSEEELVGEDIAADADDVVRRVCHWLDDEGPAT